jgi:HEAT repeat protein
LVGAKRRARDDVGVGKNQRQVIPAVDEIRGRPSHMARTATPIFGRTMRRITSSSSKLSPESRADCSWMICVASIGLMVVAAMPRSAGGQDATTLGGKSPTEWVAMLRSNHPADRDDAWLAFQILGPAAKSAVPALIDALGDPNREVKRWASLALRETRGGAVEAVPALIRGAGMRDSNDGMYNWPFETLIGLGPAAVPVLIKVFEENNPDDRRIAIQALGRCGPAAKAAVPLLVKALDHHDQVEVRCAVNALAGIGPDARAAIPALYAIWESPAHGTGILKDDVIDALKKIGASPSQRMIAALDDPDPDQRAHAVNVVSDFGAGARSAVGKLEALLDDASPMVREQAAMALWNIDPANRRVSAALAVALESANDDVVSAAIPEVAKLGPKGAALALALKKVIARTEGAQKQIDVASPPAAFELAAHAAQALVAVAPNPNEGVTYLIGLLKDGWQGQQAAAEVLRGLGPRSSAAAPALVAVAQAGKTQELRLEATLALLRVDPANAAILPSLIALASYEPAPLGPDQEDEDVPGNLKLVATVTIGRMNERALPAVPTLVRMLETEPDRDSEWQPQEWEAIPRALARIGPAAKAAVPALVRLIKAGRGRAPVGRALRAMGPAVGPAVPDLIDMLRSDQRIRVAAMEVLGGLGPEARAAVPALVEHLNDKDGTAAISAGLALLQIDFSQRDLVEAKLRAHPVMNRLRSRATVEGALGQRTPEADGLTRRYLHHLDNSLRFLAAAMTEGEEGGSASQLMAIEGIESCLDHLSIIGKGSDSTIRRVTELTQHPDPYIRRLAGDALRRIGTSQS